VLTLKRIEQSLVFEYLLVPVPCQLIREGTQGHDSHRSYDVARHHISYRNSGFSIVLSFLKEGERFSLS